MTEANTSTLKQQLVAAGVRFKQSAIENIRAGCDAAYLAECVAASEQQPESARLRFNEAVGFAPSSQDFGLYRRAYSQLANSSLSKGESDRLIRIWSHVQRRSFLKNVVRFEVANWFHFDDCVSELAAALVVDTRLFDVETVRRVACMARSSQPATAPPRLFTTKTKRTEYPIESTASLIAHLTKEVADESADRDTPSAAAAGIAPAAYSSPSSSAAAATATVPRVWQLFVTRELWAAIDRGDKTVEGRTNHRTIQPNDILHLLPLKQSPTDEQPPLYRRAAGVIVYRSFFEMIAAEGHTKLIPGSESPNDALQVYADLYCPKPKGSIFAALKQKEAVKGVMAIRMAPLSAAELSAAVESKAEPEVSDEDQLSATPTASSAAGAGSASFASSADASVAAITASASSSSTAAGTVSARSKRFHSSTADDTDTDDDKKSGESKRTPKRTRRSDTKPKRQFRRATAAAPPPSANEDEDDAEERVYEQHNADNRQKWKKRASAATSAAAATSTASASQSASSSSTAAAATDVWVDAVDVLELKADQHLVFMPTIREPVMQRGSILADVSPQVHPSLAYDPPLTNYSKLFRDKLRTVATPLLPVNPNELEHSDQKFAPVYRAAMAERPPLDESAFHVTLTKVPALSPDGSSAVTVQYMHDLNFNAWTDTDASHSHPLSPHLITNSLQSLLSVLPPEFRTRFEGVATPYAYLKLPNSFFTIHWEQLFFPSFNRQEEGTSEWCVVAPEHNELLLKALRLWVREYHADAKSVPSEEDDLLDAFFLAKQVMPTVEWLTKYGVPVTRYEQTRHQCIVLRGDAAHFGRGLSNMCLNEAINYVDLDWLSYGPGKCRTLLQYFKRIADAKSPLLSDHVMERMLNLIPNGWSANFFKRLSTDIDAYVQNRMSIVDYGRIADSQLTTHSTTLNDCIRLIDELEPFYEQFAAADL